MSVTVVSCLYGIGYDKFRHAWNQAVDQLDPSPDDVIIASGGPSPWRHRQAYYLDRAIRATTTDWVWIVDIDDEALPDAIAGLEAVQADVWMAGYIRSDGEVYVPPPLTADDVVASPRNLIPAGSFIRSQAYHECGGFLDVALQDWALWRALARNGATFETSGRAQYRYNRHPATRGATELTAERRPEHMAEMLAAEEALVAA